MVWRHIAWKTSDAPGARRASVRINVVVVRVRGRTRKRRDVETEMRREKRGPKLGGGGGGGDARACFGGRVTNESRAGARVARTGLSVRVPTAAAETESGTSDRYRGNRRAVIDTTRTAVPVRFPASRARNRQGGIGVRGGGRVHGVRNLAPNRLETSRRKSG